MTPEMETALWAQAALLAGMAVILGFLGGLISGPCRTMDTHVPNAVNKLTKPASTVDK